MTPHAIKSARKDTKYDKKGADSMPRRIGYARVSTEGQRLDLQVTALEQAGCDHIFADHGVTGARRNRPEFDKAMAMLAAGDTLVIWKLDRMSRSLRHLVDIVEELRLRGCHFECVTDAIDTSSAMGQFTFHIMAAMAELERSLISERTLAGLAAARARGQRLGRPKKGHRRHLRTRLGHRTMRLAERFRAATASADGAALTCRAIGARRSSARR